MDNIFLKDLTESEKIRGVRYYLSFFASKISPALSSKIAIKLLSNPKSRRKYDDRSIKKPKRHKIKTQLGSIVLHEFNANSKKQVLLSHGWADSTNRFTHLINKLIENDYKVWSIDHIGHGRSDGDVAHLFGFIDGLEESIKYINRKSKSPITNFIGHSMGALALLNLDLKNSKLILISMPAYFFENMFQRIRQSGFSEAFLENTLNMVSKKYKKNWLNLSPQKNINKIGSNKTFVVHDKEDSVCSYKNLMKIIEKTKYDLLSTEGLGHLKVLKDNIVLARIVEYIE